MSNVTIKPGNNSFKYPLAHEGYLVIITEGEGLDTPMKCFTTRTKSPEALVKALEEVEGLKFEVEYFAHLAFTLPKLEIDSIPALLNGGIGEKNRAEMIRSIAHEGMFELDIHPVEEEIAAWEAENPYFRAYQNHLGGVFGCPSYRQPWQGIGTHELIREWIGRGVTDVALTPSAREAVILYLNQLPRDGRGWLKKKGDADAVSLLRVGIWQRSVTKVASALASLYKMEGSYRFTRFTVWDAKAFIRSFDGQPPQPQQTPDKRETHYPALW